MKIGEAFVGMKRRGSQLLKQNILFDVVWVDTVVVVPAYVVVSSAIAGQRLFENDIG
jgi:hypothetical protein